MNKKYSDDTLLDSAREFTTLGDWRAARPKHFWAARKHGLMDQVSLILEHKTPSSHISPFTDDEIREDALRYSSRADWKRAGNLERAAGGTSKFNSATRRGTEFMDACCAHMQRLKHRHTDEELAASAAPFQHKSQWKKACPNEYNTALNRPREFFDRITAHMTAAESPYAGDYFVYAFSFSDRSMYVGLTYRKARYEEHLKRGPVAEHIAKLRAQGHDANFVYRVLVADIESPSEAARQERECIARYKSHWNLLNIHEGGSLGTLTKKWTKEMTLEEALRYKTRKDWALASRTSYEVAKDSGWFEEAAAHMPLRDGSARVGVPKSTEARQRMSEAARTPERLQAASERLAEHRNVGHTVESAAKVSAALKGKPKRPLTEEEQAHIRALRGQEGGTVDTLSASEVKALSNFRRKQRYATDEAYREKARARAAGHDFTQPMDGPTSVPFRMNFVSGS